MNIWQKGTLNYATVEIDNHLYDIHFRYYGENSYYVESVYELAAVDAHYNIINEVGMLFIDSVVDQLMILERE